MKDEKLISILEMAFIMIVSLCVLKNLENSNPKISNNAIQQLDNNIKPRA